MTIGQIQGKRGYEINIDEHTLTKTTVSDLIARTEANFPNARGTFEFRMKERDGHQYLQLREQTWFGRLKENLSISRETRFNERADALAVLNESLKLGSFTRAFAKLSNDAMTGEQARDMVGVARLVTRDLSTGAKLSSNTAMSNHMKQGQFILSMQNKYDALQAKSAQVMAQQVQANPVHDADELSAVDLDALSDEQSMIGGDDFLNEAITPEIGRGIVDPFSSHLSGIDQRDDLDPYEELALERAGPDLISVFQDEGLTSAEIQKEAFAERLQEMKDMLEFSPDFFATKIERAMKKFGDGVAPAISSDDLEALPEALDQLLRGEAVPADLQQKMLLINEAGGAIRRDLDAVDLTNSFDA